MHLWQPRRFRKRCRKKDSVTERTIQNDLAQLKKMGILSREGGRKEGRWVIVNKQGDWREIIRRCNYRVIHFANTTCEHQNGVLPLKRGNSAEKWDWKSEIIIKRWRLGILRTPNACSQDFPVFMGCHKKSIFAAHNLEVPGSSPGWSTLKIKHLRRFRRCFFFDLRTPCEHQKYFQTSHKH